MNKNTIDPTRETVLVLRTCKPGLTGYGDFQWPESGYVSAPDWEPTAECGKGLHGWLKGVGDASLGYFSAEGYQALVIETYADHIIKLGDKVKFPFGTSTSGDGGTSTSGVGGMLVIKRWTGKRYKFEVAEVGYGGLKPNVPYRLNDDGQFVEVANA